MELRGRLTRILVGEDEIWITVLYPRRWVSDLRHINFSVPSVLIGIPLVEITIFGDPEVEVSMGELARDVADAIYDEVVETLKVNLSNHGNVRIKDADVSINSYFDSVRKGNKMFEVGLIEVEGTLDIIFDPPMSPEEFKEWIRKKMKFLHEDFPYGVEDMVQGSILGLVFATLETKVKILRKGAFTIPRTEIPSGESLRNLSPFFTISFRVTASEEVLDGIKEAISKTKNEKEALKLLSFYLSVFSDVITATPVSTDDEDEYNDLSFEIHEETGRRTSLGRPEGLAILLSKISNLLG